MKIKVIKVEKKQHEDVHIMHIYPPDDREEENLYQRHGPDYWTHWLGTRHQFIRYLGPGLLEEAYQEWMRNAKQAKPPAKTNK